MTEDGQPYGPIRYKELVKEAYIITRNLNTTYNDVVMLNPTERKYLIKFLIDESKQRDEMIQKRKAEAEANRNN